MANEQPGKKVMASVTQPRAIIKTPSMKGTYCNFFTAHANPEEVVLRFGFDESGGSAQKNPQQVQILHKVILSPAMTRRVSNALVGLLEKQNAPRVRVKTQVIPRQKPN